jgi:small subunit ribosomal protein S9
VADTSNAPTETTGQTPAGPPSDSTGDSTSETYQTNEQGVAYSSESSPAADAAPRPATIAPAAATGRRKEAVARVRLTPGSGEWVVNGRTLDSYFPNKLHQQVVNEPFVTTDLVGRFDVSARIHGGGITGQAGALRLGVARALNAVDGEANRPSLKRAGLLTRDARVIERKKAGLKKARKAPQFSKR